MLLLCIYRRIIYIKQINKTIFILKICIYFFLINVFKETKKSNSNKKFLELIPIVETI